MALTRAEADTAESSARLFADFMSGHESRHFALEEAIVLPALPPGERGRMLAERVLADHRCLLDAAAKLRSGRLEGSTGHLHSLGARLRAHVRLEERELFPYLEQALDGATLGRIGEELEAARQDGTAVSEG